MRRVRPAGGRWPDLAVGVRAERPPNAHLMRLEAFRPRGAEEEIALQAARRLADGDASAPCLYLWGPPGRGKSHLLWGIAERATRLRRRAAFLTASRWARLHRGFRHKGRVGLLLAAHLAPDLLLIDGVEDLTGSPAAQRSLAELLDARRSSRRASALAGREAPYRLPLDERLADRLAGGWVLGLGEKRPAT